LPASLSQCSSLIRLGLAYNPLVSLAGIPPSLPNCDVDLYFATARLTFKGCILAEIYGIDISIRMDYEYNMLNNRTPYLPYNGPLNELPSEEIPRFVEAFFGEFDFGSNNISFPCLPNIPRGPGIIGFICGDILPEFRAFFTSFLEEISDYDENSWKEYYARHPVDLAQAYIKKPGSQDVLSQDEYERLVHECDYRLYNLLKNNLPSSDSMLQALHRKFSIKVDHQSIYL
ncbi:MAG: hypothetical protein ACTSVZ_13845, partial [Promethearchaeota archaeon]